MQRLAIVIGVVGLAALVSAQAQIASYPLPADVTYPEGIAYDAAANTIYTGSATTGKLVRVSRGSGEVTTLTEGILPTDSPLPLLGMTLDSHGRLWVAGGRGSGMGVLDASSGTMIKLFQTAGTGGVINDVAIAGNAAYVTDTTRPTLWRVPFGDDSVGDVEAWLSFEGTPITYGQGPGLNGIAATADGRSLIVVHMGSGALFRIDVADKRVTTIDIGGEALDTADGLVLDGRTLYVVRQGEQEIVTVALADDLASGTVVNRFRDPALLWPATAALAGDELLVVNTQFNKRGTNDPALPFSIVGIPTAQLAGK